MAIKHSLIGFVKTKYKSVKFEKNENIKDIFVGTYLKFYYGCNEDPKKLKPVIGKVTRIYNQGVEIYTDYGFMHSIWNRIERVFKIKTTGRMKESKIPSVNGTSSVPILDAILERIKQIIIDKKYDVDIVDKRKNTANQFSRTLNFKKNGTKISLIIKDKTSETVNVKGFPRKTTLKVTNGKTSPTVIKKIIKTIENLDSTKTQGVTDL